MTADMLIIADRGYFAFDLWQQFMATGASLLWRVAAGMKPPITTVLPDGSYLSEISAGKTRGSGWKMAEAADTAGLDPDRLSVLRTLNIVRRQVANQA